jgi:hypothetical protein
MQLIALVFVLSCSDTSETKQSGTASLETLPAVHSYRAARFEAASSATLSLLRTRDNLHTREFDPAIRELVRLLCLGSDNDTQTVVSNASIEGIFPVSYIEQCAVPVCGGCELIDGSYKEGAAFKTIPQINRSPFPEPSMRIEEPHVP